MLLDFIRITKQLIETTAINNKRTKNKKQSCRAVHLCPQCFIIRPSTNTVDQRTTKYCII